VVYRGGGQASTFAATSLAPVGTVWMFRCVDLFGWNDQVTEDTGIRSDCSRAEDEDYIVRLVGQFIQVSLETVQIVSALPKDYSG
jgi:hypothetical protein